MSGEILAVDPTVRTNADLIAHCATLGYLTVDSLTLDATYGLGRFWTAWQPDRLVGVDINPTKARDVCADFTALPFPDQTFDQTVFDPPYKLNGTGGSHVSDEGYGVAAHDWVTLTWQQKMERITAGLTECVRVTRIGGTVLVKCQDQVVSGRKVWQAHTLTTTAEAEGCRLVDQFMLLGHRPQPAGRRQVHARSNYSSLLVFRRESAPVVERACPGQRDIFGGEVTS